MESSVGFFWSFFPLSALAIFWFRGAAAKPPHPETRK